MKPTATSSTWVLGTAVLLFGTELFTNTSMAQQQNAWYVDAQDGNDANDGTPSWSQAFQTLQRALERAAANGSTVPDRVQVSQGVYTPTSETLPGDPRSATFLIQAPDLLNVAILGGYAGINTQGIDPDERDVTQYETILSGDFAMAVAGGSGFPACDNPPLGAGDCLHATSVPGCTNPACCAAVCADNPECCDTQWFDYCAAIAMSLTECTPSADRAYHVVTITGVDPTVRLDGVTITGGLADGAGTDQDRGGGVLVKDADPLLGSPDPAQLTGGSSS